MRAGLRALGLGGLALGVASLGACGAPPQTVTVEEAAATPAPSASPSPPDSQPAPPAPEPPLSWLERREGIQRLLRDPVVAWEVVTAAVAGAAQVAADADQEAEVQAWLAAIAFNRQAEDDYVAAVEQVQRGPSGYAAAQALFERVPREARVYPDAAAYLDWLAADKQVREAAAHFDRAEVADAFALLEAALGHPALGPEALASVRDRLRDWSEGLSELQALARASDPEAQRALATKLLARPALRGRSPTRFAQRAFRAASDQALPLTPEQQALEEELLAAYLAVPGELLERARQLARRRAPASEPERPPAPSRPQRQRPSAGEGREGSDGWEDDGWGEGAQETPAPREQESR